MNTLFVDTSSTENAVDGLSESFVTTYAEIARTTDNALALINALERMENDGVDTAEEYEKWVSTLTDLQTLIPSVSSLVDEQTGSIAGGTAALRDHISAWKQDGAAMARLEIIKQYYTEVAQQEFATERALRNYQAATDANSGYMQVYNQLKSQAEKHLLKTYPEHYKTYADLYATQYGTQDTSGLLFQLGQHSRNDPAAKALLDSLNSTNQKLYETSTLDEKAAYDAEKQKLDSLYAEVAELEKVMNAIMEREEQQRAKELQQIVAQRDQMTAAAQTIVDETNKAADKSADYNPDRLREAWSTLKALSPDGGKALADYLLDSEVFAQHDSSGKLVKESWAAGNKTLALPSDFFSVQNGDISILDWQAALAEFKAARQKQYSAADFFGDYDYTKRNLKTTEDTSVAHDEALNQLLPSINNLTDAIDGISSMNVVLDTGKLVGIVASEMSRDIRNRRHTGAKRA